MKKIKVYLYLLIMFMLTLIPVSYMETASFPFSYDTTPYLIGEGSEAVSVAEMAESLQLQEPRKENVVLYLEQRLVSKEEVDGYLVETYREYEIYKGNDGDVQKTVPTAHYDFIRYKVRGS